MSSPALNHTQQEHTPCMGYRPAMHARPSHPYPVPPSLSQKTGPLSEFPHPLLPPYPGAQLQPRVPAHRHPLLRHRPPHACTAGRPGSWSGLQHSRAGLTEVADLPQSRSALLWHGGCMLPQSCGALLPHGHCMLPHGPCALLPHGRCVLSNGQAVLSHSHSSLPPRLYHHRHTVSTPPRCIITHSCDLHSSLGVLLFHRLLF